ncbi:MAG: hypothetical protein AAGI07_07890 [Bacteroidota bacterium]
MKYAKSELEELISKKKTLGKYSFNEDKQHFIADVEVVLIIKKIKENLYKSQCYFFDGYEVWIKDDEQLFFEGNEKEAKEKAIVSWNDEPEIFMEFPILYTNISCEISGSD